MSGPGGADLVDQVETALTNGELTEAGARELLAQLEELQGVRQHGRWHPYPWQVCPSEVPTQGTWILLGGRGTGKTDGCARYVVDHVNGPACDKRIPGGHRIAIIAPTIGDAVESCVEGPSGLKAHNPRVVLRGGVGGNYVRWPSGAVAKLFGAHTPDDIERLRSGGNRCVVAGTLVSTERGPVPIEGVRVGDRVWTRHGLRPVTHTHDNGMRPVWKLETESGRSLYATGDHEIATPSGWSRLDVLKPTDTVLTWDYGLTRSLDRTSSPGTATAGACTRTATTGTRSGACCTALSTSGPTDPSPRAGTSTTRTTTRSTTTRPTWWPNLLPSTGPSTLTSAGRIGIAAAASRYGPIGTLSSTPASSAGGSSPAVACPGPSCAPRCAASAGMWPTSAAGPTSRTCASCAGPNSSAGSGSDQLRPRLAHDRVLRVTSPTSGLAAVHDLTVQGDHEFIAGGVLVANCCVWLEECAAMRQLGAAIEHSAFGLRIGARPHFIASTTPKPRPELRAMLADPLTVVTRGRTSEAIHLDATVRARYEAKWGGTRLGRQELDGEILDDVEGALWTWAHIDRGRIRIEERPDLVKITVAMDPSVSVTETSDECGLVAVGLAADGTAYVLGDASARMAGAPAARAAWAMWSRYEANTLVYEANQGKRWVADVLRQTWYEMQAEGLLPAGQAPPLRPVTAVFSKRLRAEPIATLYELGPPKVRHVGYFAELEDQMTTWVPESGARSPDRVDALVHAVAYLVGKLGPAEVASVVGESISGMTGMRRPWPMRVRQR